MHRRQRDAGSALLADADNADSDKSSRAGAGRPCMLLLLAMTAVCLGTVRAARVAVPAMPQQPPLAAVGATQQRGTIVGALAASTTASSLFATPPPPPPPAALASEAQPATTAPRRPARVGLIMLVVGAQFPPWWPYLTASYVRSHPTYELIVVHTGECSACGAAGSWPVRYAHVPLAALSARFVDKLGVSARRVADKFASAKGLSDLKPFYGHVFDDLLPEGTYTHWGWADWDLLLGDLPAVVGSPSYRPLPHPSHHPLGPAARRPAGGGGHMPYT